MLFWATKRKPKGHTSVPWASFLSPHPLERDHLTPALLRRVRRLRVRPGRGRFHEAANLLRRAPLHLVGDVCIRVEGEPGAEVAQHAGQGLCVHAAGEGHGSEGVPEIVEAHVFLDTGHFQQLSVDPGHRIRAPVAAGAGRREQDGVVGMLFVLPHQDMLLVTVCGVVIVIFATTTCSCLAEFFVSKIPPTAPSFNFCVGPQAKQQILQFRSYTALLPYAFSLYMRFRLPSSVTIVSSTIISPSIRLARASLTPSISEMSEHFVEA